ncbi:hypothetical protein PPOP_0754 [Paenibacillus popilliae ATCC 14706]|uniref:Uncharacterized protein n=1 Tax=Paenibacillus popilliae ATCC 14706 TaxID=1212764 RepID=M9LYX0_PAEPP|nr:hypothetical protein PPOP_0754 [Paenibacillus popilliae ATCC 14706]
MQHIDNQQRKPDQIDEKYDILDRKKTVDRQGHRYKQPGEQKHELKAADERGILISDQARDEKYRLQHPYKNKKPCAHPLRSPIPPRGIGKIKQKA